MTEPTTPEPGLPRITIEDLRWAVEAMAPHCPTLMVDYFMGWVEAQSPSLTGAALAKEILAMGAHLLAEPSPGKSRPSVHLNG